TPRQVDEQRDVFAPLQLRGRVRTGDGDTHGTEHATVQGWHGASEYRSRSGRVQAQVHSLAPMQTPDLDAVQHAVGDRYEVLSLAGVGGMGAVFRARHRTLGHIVAVKVLPPDVAASAMRHERFRREATLGASLDHPNIVRVYDFDTREGISFLIMTFVRGDTFEERLRGAPRGQACRLVSPPRSSHRSPSSRMIDRPPPRPGSPRSAAPKSGRGALGRRRGSSRSWAPVPCVCYLARTGPASCRTTHRHAS